MSAHHTDTTIYKLGLIGHNISYSRSPVIHNTLLQHTGLQGSYGIIDVAEKDLKETFERLKREGYRGVNITVPHKEKISAFLDELSPLAKSLGAVNTVVFEPQLNSTAIKLIGHNTDVEGFWNSLPESQKVIVPEQNALILGAGGAAKAILAAVLQHQPKSVLIAGRTPENLETTVELARKLNAEYGNQTVIQAIRFDQLHDLSGIQWVINTTPIGTHSDADPEKEKQSLLSAELLITLPKDAFISDLVYNPSKTKLMQEAEKFGLQTQNGLGMLIHQAMEAFTLWTGQPVDEKAKQKVGIPLKNVE